MEPHELVEGHVTLVDGRAQHIHSVLKAQVGQSLKMGVVDGPLATGVVLEMGPQGHVLLSMELGELPPPAPVDVVLALPRPKVMKRLWAPLASLGVHRLAITNAARVEKGYFEAQTLEPASHRPLLVEGLQQSGDTRLPQVSIHKRFKPFVQDELPTMFPGTRRLLAHPMGTQRLMQVGLQPQERVLLAIGPEGGWVDFEVQLLEAAGFTPVTVGHRILRTDTACVALLALVHEALASAL